MPATADDATGGPGPLRRPVDVMGRVVRRLQEEHGDVEATLQAVTAAAIQLVPNADRCGISYP